MRAYAVNALYVPLTSAARLAWAITKHERGLR